MISNLLVLKVDSKTSLNKLFKTAIDKGVELFNLPTTKLRIRLLDFEVDENGDIYSKLLIFRE